MLDREVGKAFMRWAAYTARMRHVVMTLENTTLMWLSNPGLRRAFNRWRSWFMQRTLLRRAVYNFFDGGCLIRCFWRWRRRAAVATAKKLWRQRERVRESYDAEVAIIRQETGTDPFRQLDQFGVRRFFSGMIVFLDRDFQAWRFLHFTKVIQPALAALAFGLVGRVS